MAQSAGEGGGKEPRRRFYDGMNGSQKGGIDLLTHIDELLRSGGGGVFLILLFGFISIVISSAVLAISVFKCIVGAYQLFKSVIFRNGNKKVD